MIMQNNEASFLVLLFYYSVVLPNSYYNISIDTVQYWIIVVFK